MLVIEDVELGGRAGFRVVVEGGVIREVGRSNRPADLCSSSSGSLLCLVDGKGAALLPGLHDHHIHLFALAARSASVWCGAPGVDSEATLLAVLETAVAENPGGGWIRAVGWDDTTAGWPDRRLIDEAVSARPVRLQHRSGAMWVLNSAALEVLGLDPASIGDRGYPPGVELDARGEPTGRVTGLDSLLADRSVDTGQQGEVPTGESVEGSRTFPSLRGVSAELASRGVTGVTDATEHNGPSELAALAKARTIGDLMQRVTAMTRSPSVAAPDGVTTGPVKLVLFDPDLPDLPTIVDQIGSAHEHGRAVALHAASRVGVLLAVTALRDAGCGAGDRIEHASVVPDEVVETIADLGVTIVSQPHFIAESGDRYRATVDAGDQPWLYRAKVFLDNHVPLAAGSDAPVGGSDPWAIMSAATRRRTGSGVVMAPEERLTAEEALALFTGEPLDPGGTPRSIAPGAAADLCLLDRTWARAREDLGAVQVGVTIVGGEMVHRAPWVGGGGAQPYQPETSAITSTLPPGL